MCYKTFLLEIKQGDRICILGVNGSGKSTVIKLLLRFYDVDEGEILINSKISKSMMYVTFVVYLALYFKTT